MGIAVQIDTTNETLQIRLTKDGQVIESNASAATAGTVYYTQLKEGINALLLLITTTSTLAYRYSLTEGRSVKVELRKTTAAGAGNLKGCVIYAKY